MRTSRIDPKDIEIFNEELLEALEDAKEIRNIDEYERYDDFDDDDEVHYYLISFEDSGKANFYVEPKDGSDIDLFVLDRDGFMIEDSDRSGDKHELIHSIDVVEEQEYLVGIKCYEEEGRGKYYFKTKLYPSRSLYNSMVDSLDLGETVSSSYRFYDIGDRRLERGDRGTDVTHLQRELCKMDLLSERDIDGYFGSDTEDALEEFQEKLGLDQTGEFDSDTEDAFENIIEVMRNKENLVDEINEHPLMEGIKSGIPPFTFNDLVTKKDIEYSKGPLNVTIRQGLNFKNTRPKFSINTTNGKLDGISIGGFEHKLEELWNNIPFGDELAERMGSVLTTREFDELTFTTLRFDIDIKDAIDIKKDGISIVPIEFEFKNRENFFVRTTLSFDFTYKQIRDAAIIAVIALTMAIAGWVMGTLELAKLATVASEVAPAILGEWTPIF